jgi:hypothetical protein
VKWGTFLLWVDTQGRRIQAHALADLADSQGLELEHAENAVLQAADPHAESVQPFFECLVRELEQFGMIQTFCR